jgi:BASS family bile acid:Na+ symporter
LPSATQAFVETYFIPTQLVLAMAGMGATLSVRDFLDVVKDVKGLLLGLVLQLLVVPALVLSFIEVLDLGKGWAVGLILIAVVPGGAFSNLLTYIGRGNAALSVSMTTVSNVTCILTIPLLLTLFVAEYLPADFRVPTRKIVSDICLYLLAPLVVGMVVLRTNARWAVPVAKWGIRGSLFLLVCIVVSSLGSGRIKIHEYGWAPPLALIAFGNMLWIVSGQVCRLFRRTDEDNVALTIEVSIRNIAVALLLVHFFFEGAPEQGHVLYACLFYGGLQFFIGFPIALLHRRGKSPALFWPPTPRVEAPR